MGIVVFLIVPEGDGSQRQLYKPLINLVYIVVCPVIYLPKESVSGGGGVVIFY